MVLVSRLARKGLIDSIVRQGRIQFIIWLQTVFSLLPQLLRFVILISLEALYNVYQHLNGLGPRVIESSDKKRDAVAILTGGTSGIGKEILLGLLKAGFIVHVPVRSMVKGEALVQEIGEDARGRVRLYHCDLANRRQVCEFIEQFSKASSRLDVLINNAGNYLSTFERTEEGMEKHMSVHVLSVFLLSTALAPILRRTPGSRIVNINSSLHYLVRSCTLEAFTSPKEFSRIAGYANAKYLQAMLTLQMAMTEKDILVNCVHPGMVDTDISREDLLGQTILKKIFLRLIPWIFLSAKQGALTALWAAISPELEGTTGKQLHDLWEEPINVQIIHDIAAGKGKLLVGYLAQHSLIK